MSTVAIARPHSRAATRKRLVRLFFYAFTIVLSLMFLFPFIWTLSSSLKTSSDVVAYPPTLLPRSPQWGNYPTAWNTVEFGPFFANSLWVTGLSLIGGTATGLVVAYGFSRFRFPGRRALFISLLAANAFPKIGLYVAIATLFFRLDLMGTYWGVVIIQLVGTLVVMVWIPAAGFDAVPQDLEEAARDAGAGPLRVFWSITLPLAMPGIIVASFLAFLAAFVEAQGTLIVGSPTIVTMPVLMYTLVVNYPEPVGAIFSILLSAPSVILLLVARRYLLAGYLAAGFKGR
jgi:putative spermidine/putrescine transport system permease protein